MLTGNSGYSIFVRQHPQAARACGSADRPDRRPVDPIVILQLLYNDRADFFADSTTAAFFVYATMAPFRAGAYDMIQPPYASNLLTGTTISSVFYLKDPANNGELGAFFVFPDLNIRAEGTYRLRFDLFGMKDNRVSPLNFCLSNPFTVYSAKRFPGMTNSTELSRSFADQGLKVRIRKDLRPRKRSRGQIAGPSTTSELPVETSQPMQRHHDLSSSSSSQQTYQSVSHPPDHFTDPTNPTRSMAFPPYYHNYHVTSTDQQSPIPDPSYRQYASNPISFSAQHQHQQQQQQHQPYLGTSAQAYHSSQSGPSDMPHPLPQQYNSPAPSYEIAQRTNTSLGSRTSYATPNSNYSPSIPSRLPTTTLPPFREGFQVYDLERPADTPSTATAASSQTLLIPPPPLSSQPGLSSRVLAGRRDSNQGPEGEIHPRWTRPPGPGNQ